MDYERVIKELGRRIEIRDAEIYRQKMEINSLNHFIGAIVATIPVSEIIPAVTNGQTLVNYFKQLQDARS